VTSSREEFTRRKAHGTTLPHDVTTAASRQGWNTYNESAYYAAVTSSRRNVVRSLQRDVYGHVDEENSGDSTTYAGCFTTTNGGKDVGVSKRGGGKETRDRKRLLKDSQGGCKT